MDVADSLGVTSTTTWPDSLSIVVANAPAPPSQFKATSSTPGVVDLSWSASPTATVSNYNVVLRAGGTNAEVRQAVGNELTTEVSGLDVTRGYEVWAVAQDGEGRTSSPSNVAKVAWRSCAPSAAATVPTLAAQGDRIDFSSQLSADGCAGVTTYEWSFGDGTSTNTPQTAHTYAATGQFRWTLRTTTDGHITQTSDVIRVDQRRCGLTVKQPFNGAVLMPGQPSIIAWSADGACGNDARLELLRDTQVIETISDSATGGVFVWVPSDRTIGVPLYLRITDRSTGLAVLSKAFVIGSTPRRRTVRH
jgi:hypothetical protein